MIPRKILQIMIIISSVLMADEKLVTNFRMNLIHAPLSDLFLVHSNISDLKGDEKDNGMIALKFTKLFSL